MKPTDITLHFAPDSCPRVTLTALEEIGVNYDLKVIAFMREDHVNPDYLKLNPLGGVPTLEVDGKGLFENPSILKYLAEVYPEAELLPKCSTPLERWEQNSIFDCLSADIHPQLSLMRFPFMYTDVPEVFDSLGEKGASRIRQKMAWMDARLSSQPWLMGEEWSILDAYLSWAWFRTVGSQIPAETFPNIDAMSKRHGERPSAKRVAAIETKAITELKAANLWFEPKA